MDAIQDFIKQNRVAVMLVIGILLGLFLGVIYGWYIAPVRWVNTTPAQLRSDFRNDYLIWLADRYHETGDLSWACQKLGIEYWEEGQLAQTLTELGETVGGERQTRLLALAAAADNCPAEAEQPEPSEPGFWSRFFRTSAQVCGIGLLALAVVGLGFFLVRRLQMQRAASEAGPTPAAAPTTKAVDWGEEEGPPVARFPSTYVLGDDHYDPSFSIETEGSEFLGECGVGISETIGVGAPNKVTAFEVWLFDKSDIRTVTKVVMSPYAYHDEALHTKLAPKGEPILVEEGKDVVLETKTLRVRARIVELSYGEGDLPQQSFFERFSVELAAWVKPGADTGAPMPIPDEPIGPSA